MCNGGWRRGERAVGGERSVFLRSRFLLTVGPGVKLLMQGEASIEDGLEGRCGNGGGEEGSGGGFHNVFYENAVKMYFRESDIPFIYNIHHRVVSKLNPIKIKTYWTQRVKTKNPAPYYILMRIHIDGYWYWYRIQRIPPRDILIYVIEKKGSAESIIKAIA